MAKAAAWCEIPAQRWPPAAFSKRGEAGRRRTTCDKAAADSSASFPPSRVAVGWYRHEDRATVRYCSFL